MTRVCCDPGHEIGPGLCSVTQVTMPMNSTINIPVKREPMLYHVSMATLFLASRLWFTIILNRKNLSAYD